MWAMVCRLDHARRSFSSARFGMIGELLVNVGQNASHKCMDVKDWLHFSPQHHCVLPGYPFQTKAKVMCFIFLRTELCVKLVFEVKSAVDFFSPYIYD